MPDTALACHVNPAPGIAYACLPLDQCNPAALASFCPKLHVPGALSSAGPVLPCPALTFPATSLAVCARALNTRHGPCQGNVLCYKRLRLQCTRFQTFAPASAVVSTTVLLSCFTLLLCIQEVQHHVFPRQRQGSPWLHWGPSAAPGQTPRSWLPTGFPTSCMGRRLSRCMLCIPMKEEARNGQPGSRTIPQNYIASVIASFSQTPFRSRHPKVAPLEMRPSAGPDVTQHSMALMDGMYQNIHSSLCHVARLEFGCFSPPCECRRSSTCHTRPHVLLEQLKPNSSCKCTLVLHAGACTHRHSY